MPGQWKSFLSEDWWFIGNGTDGKEAVQTAGQTSSCPTISSVTTVLTRYSQDTGSNFSADLRSTFENFSDKERMELMAINSKGRVTLTTSGFAPDTGTAMPDYETAMESETGTWTGRQNGERVMAVSVNISAMQPEYNAIRVVSSMSQIDATLRDYTTMITIVCIGVLLPVSYTHLTLPTTPYV